MRSTELMVIVLCWKKIPVRRKPKLLFHVRFVSFNHLRKKHKGEEKKGEVAKKMEVILPNLFEFFLQVGL